MINAIRYTEKLEKAGFSSEQAKNSVDVWMSLMNENFATKSDMREFQLVNKSELREVQVSLQNDMKDLRTDLETQIKDLRTDLETQIKDLKTENDIKIKNLENQLAATKNDILFKLGSLMIALFTVSTAIISIQLSRM